MMDLHEAVDAMHHTEEYTREELAFALDLIQRSGIPKLFKKYYEHKMKIVFSEFDAEQAV